MATFYLVLVIVLFILAFSDLVVGVSNDAVNFLNSAVGAKTASFRIIMSVAAAGVLVGATFSSGMMEVARKGIFHPEYFYFSEIIIIFLAVMVTDVILLDAFNTFGMPTSTTVSIVFELLGAAVAISAVKVFTDPDAMALYDYINSGKALAIIAGILLSVVIAFSCGVVAQYFSRLFFSFDYEKRMRQFGAVWGGLGVTGITYFMLIKGVKGTSFMSVQAMQRIEDHTGLILLGSLVGWTLILFILNRVFKVDILKVLVLVGTFALAMAFAGNDLVNFIGVPLAGYNSYQLFMESGAGAEGFLMDGLAGQVPTPTILLLLAGLVMVVTLFLSKKARSVVQTSLDLGRQEEGSERFSSFLVSRSIVRNFAKTATLINDRLPNAWTNAVNRRFDQTPFTTKQEQLGKDAPVFDMIRASVTLAVASILIAIGTNLKLPLSTTYVTFMVFMGTSLADGAWGRESAVYRVSGVLSVIGGWFFTAFSAFTMAFIMAMIFHFGGLIAIGIVLVMAAAVIYRTHRYHHNKMEQQRALEKDFIDETLNRDKLIELCNQQLSEFLVQFSKQVDKSFKGLRAEDLGMLNSARDSLKPVLEQLSALKRTSHKLLDRIPDSVNEAGHVFLLVVDYLHEMGKLSMTLVQSNLDHVDNYHKPLLPEQIEELISLHQMLEERYHSIIELYQDQSARDIEKLNKNFNSYINIIRNVRKQQIKRIKNDNVGTRNSRLFLSHLADLRTLGLFSDRMVKIYDELLLNPNLEEEFSADSIRKAITETN